MLEPFLDGMPCARKGLPRLVRDSPALDGFRQYQQAIGGVGAAVEQHIFDVRLALRRNLLVNGQLPGIDDAHVRSARMA